MCYYNGQKVTHAEFIRLKGLEKLVASYGFLNTDLHEGFAYGNIAALKPVEGKVDFDIVQMEWGFIPDSWFGKPLDTRAKVKVWRDGYKDAVKGWVKGITTLNAGGEEKCCGKTRSTGIQRLTADVLFCQRVFTNGGTISLQTNEPVCRQRQPLRSPTI